MRPFVERRTKFARSVDEYDSEREKSKLKELADIVQESISRTADDAQREIKADIQASRRTLSRLLKDYSNWTDKSLIYRPG
uniref:Transposase n=1 Tax=Steinernema glaseri TaxID=37863 RepID=A0A1I8AWR1_9BILA